MIELAIDFLLDAQNPDGGWGAVKGIRSNTESTSFALMALKCLERDILARPMTAALSWLLKHQKNDGSWSLNDALKQSSWTTPIATLALLPFQDQGKHALMAAQWILTKEGRKPGRIASVLALLSFAKKMGELDPYLSGWPWTAGAFSWVEPTSYSLIALKKLKPMLDGTNVKARIQQGETLIYDRMCEGGGWNYGNSKVMGETLWPYPDVTAIALIALRDRAASEANQKSLHVLHKMARQAASGMALGWGILCLALYNEDVAELKHILTTTFEKTRFLGETKTVALALLAFGDGANLFRV